MKPIAPIRQPISAALLLAIPTSDPAKLVRQLARTPPLQRRKPTYQVVDAVYHDTPEQRLHQQHITWRTQRVDGDEPVQWRQFLHVEKRENATLRRYEEWTSPIRSSTPEMGVLQSSTGSRIDPDGTAFRTLAPCFSTRTERTSWSIHQRDGSLIDVVLNVGHLSAGGQTVPVFELELVLLAGHPAALFEVAQKISRTLAVLPTPTSSAERGLALARGTLDAPLKALPVTLKKDVSLAFAAGCMLNEMLGQFIANLYALCTSEDPEVVHQARVGWRRFKSAVRLFRPALPVESLPSWEPLEPLLGFLGTLRDLDVALTETLPRLNEAYTAGDIGREETWAAMTQAMQQAAHLQRKSVRYALQAPEVGTVLLETLRWIEGLLVTTEAEEPLGKKLVALRPWARHRVGRLHKQLTAAAKDIGHLESQHRIRILAKRMRYSTESLQTFLPKMRAERWHQQAAFLQATLGFTRDTIRASALAAEVGTDPRLVEFLRGAAAGQQTRDATQKNGKI